MRKTNPVAAFVATLFVLTGAAAASPVIHVHVAIEIRLVRTGE